MKKKIIIISIVIIIALAAIVIITTQFPSVSGEETSGTIGKVDKYRKVQMTEKDIILRSEFVTDTTALAKSIQGLLFFNTSIKQYSTSLKVCADYLKKHEPSVKQTKTIEEYTQFIDNNVSTIEKTIGLLADFYSGDTTDYSIDVENKLKEFNNFTSQIALKDSVVLVALAELEHNIKFTITNAPKKDEGIQRLKNIHDQMLIKNFQQNILIGNTEILKFVLNKPLYNIQNLGAFQNSQINIYGAVYSKNDLNVILSKDQLGCLNKGNLQSYYNKTNLGVNSNINFGSIVNQAKIDAAISNTNSSYQAIASKSELFAGNNLGYVSYNNSNSFGGIVLNLPFNNLQSLINSTLSSNLAQKLDGIELTNSALGEHHILSKPLGSN